MTVPVPVLTDKSGKSTFLHMRTLRADTIREEWSTPDTHAKLRIITERLRQQPNFGGQIINAATVAQTSAGLQIFCENHLGRDGRHKTRQMKLPAQIFRDFRADGPLAHALIVCFQHKVAGPWEAFGFESSANVEQLLSMVSNIEFDLRSKGLVKVPSVYLSDELSPADAASASKELLAKGVKLVSSSDLAIYTVVPDPAGTSKDDYKVENCVREVGPRVGSGDAAVCRVHWWYYPDSYEEWVPLSQLQGSLQGSLHTEKEIGRACWTVQKRWVDDLVLFNEFMNPRDYAARGPRRNAGGKFGGEVTDQHQFEIHEGVCLRKQGPSRGRAPMESARPKRRRSTKADFNADIDGASAMEEWALDPASALPDAKANANQRDLDRVSLAQTKSYNLAGENGLVVHDISNCVAESFREGTISVAKEATFAKRSGKLHAGSYSTWFDSSCIHAKERAAMPDFFNGQLPSKNSHTYRQYRSFMIDAYRRNPSQKLRQSTCRESLAGDIGGIADVYNCLELWGLINHSCDTDLVQRRSDSYTDKAHLDQLHSCKQQPTKKSGMRSSQDQRWRLQDSALQMSATPAPNDDRWTDSETLVLLRALQKHQDDWDTIATEVQSRTKEQCFVRFVRMAIDDPFFMHNAAESEPGHAKISEMPFLRSDNPLLGQLHFFCNVVHPSIAAAAAAAGLRQLMLLEDEGTSASLPHINTKDVAPEVQLPPQLHGPRSVEQGRQACVATCALSAAVTRAKTMAETEERRTQLLLLESVKLQSQKMELKMKHFKELEAMMDLERTKVATACSNQEHDRTSQIDFWLHSRSTRNGPKIHLVNVTPVSAQDQIDCVEQFPSPPPPRKHYQEMATGTQQVEQQQIGKDSHDSVDKTEEEYAEGGPGKQHEDWCGMIAPEQRGGSPSQRQRRQQLGVTDSGRLQIAPQQLRSLSWQEASSSSGQSEGIAHWKAAWSDKYSRWYWWHVETMETRWEKPS